MLPFCYEAGLQSGHVPEVALLMCLATDNFVKEVMASIFSRTRSNGPGDTGNAAFGPSGAWVQTHRYKRQLARDEEAFTKGEVTRDKGGLLPAEAKAASGRGPLGMGDLRVALEMADCGLASLPIISKSVVYNYREGELETWNEHAWVGDDGLTRTRLDEAPDLDGDVHMGDVFAVVNGVKGGGALPNGTHHTDLMEMDDDIRWDGADDSDADVLDSVLDSVLAVG